MIDKMSTLQGALPSLVSFYEDPIVVEVPTTITTTFTPVLDPFYLVKEEIQDSVNKLQTIFARWEQLPTSLIQDFLDLSKELSTGCETIEWQVDELDRAISVAERDPARFSIDVAEIERRKNG